VKGKGIQSAQDSGDLIVTVDVVVPKETSKQEQKVIEELARLSTESVRSHIK
jgi:DnaJ-class molecular chaperone